MNPTSHSQSPPSGSHAASAAPSSASGSTPQKISGLAKGHFRVSSILPPTTSPLAGRTTIVIPSQSSRTPLATGGAASSAIPLRQRSVLQRAATLGSSFFRGLQQGIESSATQFEKLIESPMKWASDQVRSVAPNSSSGVHSQRAPPSSLSTSRSSSPPSTDTHASIARSNTGSSSSGSDSSSSLSGSRASLALVDLYQENNRNCMNLMFGQDLEQAFVLSHPEFSEITTPELGQRAINAVSQFINSYLTPILETTRQSTELLYQQSEIESMSPKSSSGVLHRALSFFSREDEKTDPFTLDMKILTYFNEEDRDRAHEYGPMNDQVRYDCIKGVINKVFIDPKKRGVCFAKALSLAIRDSRNNLANWMLFGQEPKLAQKDCSDMDFEQFSPEMRIRLGIKMAIAESNYDFLFQILDKIPKEDQTSYFPIAFHDLCGRGHEEALEGFLSAFDPPPEIKEAALACAQGTDREESVRAKLDL